MLVFRNQDMDQNFTKNQDILELYQKCTRLNQNFTNNLQKNTKMCELDNYAYLNNIRPNQIRIGSELNQIFAKLDQICTNDLKKKYKIYEIGN